MKRSRTVTTFMILVVYDRKTTVLRSEKETSTDFTKDRTASPAVTRYMQRSFFDENIAKHKGFSMGVGRSVL
jgi:hypothetical protein